jgi:DNA-3-methyladenine glycosylase II
VWRRLLATLPAPTPQAVAATAPEVLRACGLSARKVEYLRDLAGHFLAGRLHTARWDAMDDSAIIAELTDVRGIGRWTAEMFLIFHLWRPDVWPIDDLGLRRALVRHAGLPEKAPRRVWLEAGERWRPWRTAATWYFWRSLEAAPVIY